MFFNRVIIAGRVIAKETRQTSNNNLVVNLRLGVKEEKNVPLTHVDVVLWSKLAEQGDKKIEKDSVLVVEGVLRQDRWVNKEGEKRTKLYIKANKFCVLDMNRGGQGEETVESEEEKKEE